MRYKNTLIAVADMEASKRFYHEVLGLEIIADFGANVTLSGGIVLQTMDTWKAFLKTDTITLPNNAAELYFEEEDLDAFCRYLKGFEIHYVHKLLEHRWGQRVVRFYDPDHHIIEVGEPLSAVVIRFKEQGLSPEEIAVRMDIPLDFVISCLHRGQE